ncbi:MAG: DUF370 domain-containing protein [Lachnospiraceae bacterium]|jgi:regulator of extracellular matrix RemA (YlzA/DUF370 family)|nr:DUF370 domain-containing protein [Lachnospiraceae bacterium]HAP33324.1 hypothetical protein [Lachnospiraceae bacterium]HBR05392.1 hypothetical protein [Lachnospiraceae bacterium]HBZ89398.1 hypothetical protein [Lachnospiraceae bacterium]
MDKIINIGYGNLINSEKVIAIVKPDAAPIKRVVSAAKDDGSYIDATCGKKCRSVIFTTDSRIVLAALTPDTIANRINGEVSGKSLIIK